MASCRCGRTWAGLAQAHCCNETSVGIPLAPWDGDTSVLAKRYTHLDQLPVDGGWVTADLATDLVSAPTGGVEARSLLRPRHELAGGLLIAQVQRVMLSGGQWTQVLWAVVGPVMVDVVHVLIGRDPAVDHPVLVGLDVAPRTDVPSQQDVPVLTQVPTRLVRRDLLSRRKGANSPVISGVGALAIDTAASLSSAGNGLATVNADDGSHAWSLQVTALCHSHFGSVRGFDRHRATGRCVQPDTIATRAGKPVFRADDGPLGVTWVLATDRIHPGQARRLAEEAEDVTAA